MTIPQYIYDIIVISAIFIGIFIVLYVRKNVKFDSKTRLVPFREPLVPKEFWKVCSPSDPPVIVWIVRHYLPDYKTETTRMIHDLNKYFIEGLGWTVKIITPYSSVKSYEGIPIFQFHEKTDLEIAIARAHCIISASEVVVTAAITAKRARKPLILLAEDETMGQWIEKANRLHKSVNVVNASNWIANINDKYGLNSIVVNPPIEFRRYTTHTERRYITLVNMSENRGVRQFFEMAKALPEYEFLAVGSDGYVSPMSENVTMWHSQTDMRVVYSVTGILCMPSKSETWGSSAIEAMASGIPVIASDLPVLRESIGYAGIFLEREDSEGWVDTIRKLKTDSLFYRKFSELAAKRAKEMDPKSQLERFKVWVEGSFF
jgi:glycosyltransferase involved in cell wall biosynthesis